MSAEPLPPAAEKSPRNPRIERVIVAGWLFIIAKSFLVIWVIDRYHMGFSPAWIIVPTVMFALLCTGVYFWRD